MRREGRGARGVGCGSQSSGGKEGAFRSGGWEMCASRDFFWRRQVRQIARRRNINTPAPAEPPAMARTWACVRPVDGDEVGVGVGEEVRLAARSVVFDEDEDEVVVVVCELVGEEVVSVVLLLL